jgi:hypothetical protein
MILPFYDSSEIAPFALRISISVFASSLRPEISSNRRRQTG